MRSACVAIADLIVALSAGATVTAVNLGRPMCED